MRLESLTVTGLPGGLDVAVDTRRPTLLLGGNTRGKTRTLAALDGGLAGPSAGSWPGLGSLVADMRIDLQFDATRIERIYDAKGRTTLTVVGGRKVGPRESKAAVAQALGAPVGVDHVDSGRLDLSALLGLSANERGRWLLSNVYGRSYAIERVREVLIERGIDVSELDAIADMPDWKKALKPGTLITKPATARDGQQLLEAVDGLIREYVNALTAERKQHTAAIESDEKLAAESDLPPGTAASYNAEVERLQSELAPIDARIRASLQAATRRTTQEAAITRDTGTLRLLVAEIEALPATIAARREALAVAQERLAAVPEDAGTKTALAAARAAFTTARDAVEKAEANQTNARAAVTPLQRTLAEAEALVLRLSAPVDARTVLREEIDGFVKGIIGTVPSVSEAAESAKRWDALLTKLTAYLPASADPTGAELAAAQEALATARENLEGAKGRVEATGRIVANRSEALTRARAEADQAVASDKAATDLRTDATRAVDVAKRDLDEVVASEKKLIEQHDRLAAALAAARQEFEALNPEGVEALERQVAQLREKIGEARAKSERLVRAHAQREIAEGRARKAGELTEKLERWRAYAAKLAQVRNALAEEAKDPIADIAGIVYGRVLGGSLAIVNGDVILTRAGQTYPIAQASGAETAIVGAALTAAVSSVVGGWRAVVIDEINTIEHALRTALASVLYDLTQEETIDNVILAGWPDGVNEDGTPGMPEIAALGYNIHDLGGAA